MLNKPTIDTTNNTCRSMTGIWYVKPFYFQAFGTYLLEHLFQVYVFGGCSKCILRTFPLLNFWFLFSKQCSKCRSVTMYVLLSGTQASTWCNRSSSSVGAIQVASFSIRNIANANHETRSLPLRPGGAENCNITFFEGRGVKNVILQYSILREKCNLTFFGTMGKLKKM